MSRKQIDWEDVEQDFRAGIKSLRQMGEEYGCSHVSIKKKADKEGWTRDLSKKIKAEAQALVNSDAVTSEVNTVTKNYSERDVVTANAALQAEALRGQRKDIVKCRLLVMQLIDELSAISDPENQEALEGLGEMMRNPDCHDKANEAYRKVLSLPSRIKGMKDLADALKTLVALERQAFNIDERVGEDNQIAVIERRIIDVTPEP